MGVLSRSFERKSVGSNIYDKWIELINGGVKSKAGPAVNLNTAFRVSAALACMRHIATGVAQVPFKLMQDYDEGGLQRKRVAREHPLYDVLTVKPNGWQTSYEFRETLALHACMGNAYVFKNFYRGQIAELIILDPSRVTAEQKDDWSIVYNVRGGDGVKKEIPSNLIWHVRGLSWDGFLGVDTLSIVREALGLSVALEDSHASLHSNGIRTSGVYSVDGTLDKASHEALVNWLKKQAGADMSGAPMVLDRNAKWVSTSMSGIDAQHLETRDHQIEEVCRFFGVIPLVIGYSGDKTSTYASAEAMFTADRAQTKDPWYTRIQESADVNLLTEAERKSGYYWKFNANGLMRAQAKDRSEYFAKALGSGGSPAWMTQDEIRMIEDLDPMGGESAKLPARLMGATPASPVNNP